MKIQSPLLLMFCLSIFFPFSTISQNITDSTATVVDIKPPKKKIKSRETYIGFYKPFFNATTKQTRSDLLFSDFDADLSYYSYQSYRRHYVKLTGTRGLTIGYNKSRKITEKIYFKTGFGINIFGVGYDKSYIEDSIRIITKYKRISNGQESTTEITQVNEFLTNFNTQSTILGSPYDFFVASLQIPIAAEILISPKLQLWGGVNYNFVFAGSVYSYHRYGERITYDFEETQLIRRTYVAIDLHLKYNFYKNFFFDINGALVGGVFNSYRGLSTKFFEGVTNISGYNFGLRIGYNF